MQEIVLQSAKQHCVLTKEKTGFKLTFTNASELNKKVAYFIDPY
jgi:hypothetical protein